MINNVIIEQPIALKTQGFRFNAYFWLEAEDRIIIDLYAKGFRVFGGKIHLPSFSSRIPHPNIYLPNIWATKLVETLLKMDSLRTSYPEVFPLVRRDILIQELQYPKAQIIQDFPQLAAARNLLEQ